MLAALHSFTHVSDPPECALNSIAAIEEPALTKPDASWTFVVEPYLWLAGIDGKGSADTSPPTSIDVWGKLSGAFMIRGEARAPHSGFTLLADGLTLTLKDEDGFTQTRTEATMGELGVAVPIADRGRIEAIAGVRRIDLDFDVELGGVVTGRAGAEWIDPWVGVRGDFDLGGDWSVLVRGDVGGFGVGSDLTWQAAASFDVDLSDTFRLGLGYRALSIEYEDDDLDFDAVIHGPLLGLAIVF
jgi:hypothetical protein